MLVAQLRQPRSSIDNRAITFTHGDGVGIRRPHHHAFGDGLPADNQISFVCAHDNISLPGEEKCKIEDWLPPEFLIFNFALTITPTFQAAVSRVQLMIHEKRPAE